MKPFSKTEMKILVYKKVQKGIPYEQAVKEVKDEVKVMSDMRKFERAKQKATEIWKKEQL